MAKCPHCGYEGSSCDDFYHLGNTQDSFHAYTPPPEILACRRCAKVFVDLEGLSPCRDPSPKGQGCQRP